MAYETKYTNTADLIAVEVFGKRKKGKEVLEAVGFLEEIAGRCIKSNVSKVLIISHITGFITTQDVMNILSIFSNNVFSHGLKIAVFFIQSDSDRYNSFTEFIAKNRGLDMKVFNSEEEARVWLDTP